MFSELIQAFGVTGAKVEECYSIDPETLGPLAPVYGLVFLFKHTGSAELRPGAVLAPEATDVFFANQVWCGVVSSRVVSCGVVWCVELCSDVMSGVE